MCPWGFTRSVGGGSFTCPQTTRDPKIEGEKYKSKNVQGVSPHMDAKVTGAAKNGGRSAHLRNQGEEGPERIRCIWGVSPDGGGGP
jgi:hypothetical protein